MNCEEVRNLLSEYLDGFLPEDKKVEVERHLQSCSLCQKELEHLKSISFAIQKLPEEPLPEDFTNGLHQKLIDTKQDRPKRVYQKGWVKTVSVLAAAFIIVVALTSNNAIVDIVHNTSDQTADSSTPEYSIATEEPSTERYGNYNTAIDDGGAAGQTDQSFAADIDVNGAQENAAAQKQMASVDRKIISNAYMQLEVAEYQTAFDAITHLSEKYQGYVASSNTYYDTEGNVSGGNLTIKVDAKSFQQAIEEIKQYGSVTNINYSTNDITSDYYDVQGRIEQYELQESRLMEILAKAENVSDMITVEQELASVRVALDSLKGQMQLYDQLTTLSTINIEMAAPAPDTTSVQTGSWSDIGSKIKAGFVAGFNYLLSWLAKLLVAIVFILPIAIIAAIVLIVVWQILKHRSKKKMD